MARYELVVKRSVDEDLHDLPAADVARVLQRMEALASNPRPAGCERLSGQERYRVRQGAYRILYEVDDTKQRVTVVKIGRRRDAYRRF